MTGLAAGNGRASAPYQQYQFTGVAPRADIIAVRMVGEASDRSNEVNIVRAVDCCIQGGPDRVVPWP